VEDCDQWTLVALAHGRLSTRGSFSPGEDNAKQLRLFRSIRQWSDLLKSSGFKRSEPVIAQDHDPTKNLLLEFVKA